MTKIDDSPKVFIPATDNITNSINFSYAFYVVILVDGNQYNE